MEISDWTSHKTWLVEKVLLVTLSQQSLDLTTPSSSPQSSTPVPVASPSPSSTPLRNPPCASWSAALRSCLRTAFLNTVAARLCIVRTRPRSWSRLYLMWSAPSRCEVVLVQMRCWVVGRMCIVVVRGGRLGLFCCLGSVAVRLC
jgi:hypothetical protein